MSEDFDVPDLEDLDALDDKKIRYAPKPIEEPTCNKIKCRVCTKMVYTCRCHDLYAAQLHDKSWVCGESCWAIYAESLGLRKYMNKQAMQRVEAINLSKGEKSQGRTGS